MHHLSPLVAHPDDLLGSEPEANELASPMALVNFSQRWDLVEIALAPEFTQRLHMVQRALGVVPDPNGRARGSKGDRELGLEARHRVVALLAGRLLDVVPILLDPREGAPELGQVGHGEPAAEHDVEFLESAL